MTKKRIVILSLLIVLGLSVAGFLADNRTEKNIVDEGYSPYVPSNILDSENNSSQEIKSALAGKKIVYDGDSICSSWGESINGGSYPKIIADTVDGTYDNQGVGGGVFISHDTSHSIVDNLTNLPTDGDLYCFEGGVNDYSIAAPLGSFSPTDYNTELDTTTFCGAVEQVCRYSMEKFVGKPICFIIVHKCPYCAFVPNDIGLTFDDYRQKMIGILEKYSIPYYDAFKESGLNGMNEVHKANYFIIDEKSGTGDGWHPNEEGYRRYYVPQLIALFEKIMPVEEK